MTPYLTQCLLGVEITFHLFLRAQTFLQRAEITNLCFFVFVMKHTKKVISIIIFSPLT